MNLRMLLLLLLTLVLFTNFQCSKGKDGKAVYMGRLELKGPCGQYTISLLKGKMDRNLIQKVWTDLNTGRSYKNVFAVANSCSFPANELSEGDTIAFTIGGKPQNCMVCQIFVPTPEKKLPVTVTKILSQKLPPQP